MADDGHTPSPISAQPTVFAALHRGQARGIYNLALRLLRHHQDAEDVTQEVLLKLFLQGPGQESASTRAWAYRVTYNACCDQLRRDRRRGTALQLDEELAPAAGDPYQQDELARLIETSLRRLPVRQRTALLLRELHGLHPAEVASVLGAATPSVEVTLTRARRSFRARYCELTGEKAPTVGVGALALVALPASLHLSAVSGALGAFSGGSAGASSAAGSALVSGSGVGAAAGGTAALGGGSGIASQTGVGLISKIGGALSTKVAVAVLSAALVAGGASHALHSHRHRVLKQSVAQGAWGQRRSSIEPLSSVTPRPRSTGLVASQPKPRVSVSAQPTLGSAPLAVSSPTPSPSATVSPPATIGAGSPSPTSEPSPSPSTSASATTEPLPSPTTSPSPTSSSTTDPSLPVAPSPSSTVLSSFRLAPSSAAWRARLGASGEAEQPTSAGSLPVSLSYIDAESPSATTTYPASYDLRTLNKLPAIDDVGAHNACWAFAALDSLESRLLPSDPQLFSTDNLLLASGFSDTGYDSGGNDLQATAYLARWSGPVSAAAEPYGAGVTAGLKPLKHVQDVLFLPPRKGPLANSTMKWALTTYGAVEVGMYVDPAVANGGSTVYDATDSSYYSTTAQAANHAVDIVGWNNAYPAGNFATRPPGDGAFLVRNCWGGSWGDGGYFWVSYYDTTIAKSDNAVFSDAEPTSNYKAIYQYDPLGWTDQAAIGYATDTAWFANRFKARKAQRLTAVSFYSSAAASRYRIYASLGSPSTRLLVAAGTLAWPGYHTVRLTKPLGLLAGRFFSVSVRLITPGSHYPIPLEERIEGYSDAAVAAAGQSYVSSNGADWTDVTTLAGQHETNVCLKAFAS